MLNKWYSILFAVLLLTFSVVNLAIPQKSFSENENRTLMQFPDLNGEDILSGIFMRDFESYASDQFLGRDFFITTKAMLERMAGKKENNGVYFGKEDYLIQKMSAWTGEQLAVNLSALKKLVGTGKYQVQLALVPTAYEIYREKLPAYAYEPQQKEILALVREQLAGSGVKLIDPASSLEEKKAEYLYYRTDHHQTAYGGFYIYRKIARSFGIEPYALEDFAVQEVSDAFYGTTWSEATLPGITADSIYLFEAKKPISFVTEFVGEDKKLEGLYDLSALTKKDKYAVYLGGNHAITKITSEVKNGKKLAVFKDSYAHNIVPFLAHHYEEIHMIDPRYYSLDALSYLAEQGISDILVLYSTANFAADTNVFKISAYLK